MRRRYVIVLVVIVILTVTMGVLPLQPNYSRNTAYSSQGGESSVQIMDLRFGARVSLQAFSNGVQGCQPSVCTQANNDVVFSIQSPDGSYLVRNANMTRELSYSFIAWRPGHYRLNFTDPVPGGAFSAVLNATVYQPIAGQYFPFGGAYVVEYPCMIQCVCVSGTCDNMDPLVPSG